MFITFSIYFLTTFIHGHTCSSNNSLIKDQEKLIYTSSWPSGLNKGISLWPGVGPSFHWTKHPHKKPLPSWLTDHHEDIISNSLAPHILDVQKPETFTLKEPNLHQFIGPQLPYPGIPNRKRPSFNFDSGHPHTFTSTRYPTLLPQHNGFYPPSTLANYEQNQGPAKKTMKPDQMPFIVLSVLELEKIAKIGNMGTMFQNTFNNIGGGLSRWFDDTIGSMEVKAGSMATETFDFLKNATKKSQVFIVEIVSSITDHISSWFSSGFDKSCKNR